MLGRTRFVVFRSIGPLFRQSARALTTLVGVTFLLGALAADAESQDFQLQENTDYFGADFKSFAVPNGDLYACVKACRSDNQCQSFTFGKVDGQGTHAMCWLKNSIPSTRQNSCCTSGKKIPSMLMINVGPTMTLQSGLDYSGADIKRLVLDKPEPMKCASACSVSKECKAYTYVKPGQQGPAAICYLKDEAKNANSNACCSSGIKSMGLAKLDDVTVSPNKNRQGGDYKNFALNIPDVQTCQSACSGDTRCLAYTFVAPANGKPSQCWLKDTIPPETDSKCCISGIKTPVSGVNTALVRGEAKPVSKSCDSGIVQDAFSLLCSIFECPFGPPKETCMDASRQITAGS